MKVKFNVISYVYHGQDAETNLPLIEKKIEDVKVGEVVGNFLGKGVMDCLGNQSDEPYFILLLEDGSFTSAPISKCKKLED